MATELSRVEANRLYWETDTSVGGIAEQLGVSRRALYDLLESAPLQQRCPHCGGTLHFANRLARSSGQALCAACGAAAALAPVTPAEPATRAPVSGPAEPELARRLPPLPGPPARASSAAPSLSTADFALAAIVGLAGGLVVALMLSRKRAQR